MKNLLLCLIALLIFNISSLAQAPEKFKYQAIITNNKDLPVRNKTIGLEISILQSNLDGTIVYQETFTTRTSNAGLVNLEIGTGIITSGVFSDINWGVDPYYLGIGVDMNGSGNYISMGASQLLSVPYALYAKQAQSVDGDNDTDPTNEIELPTEDGTEGQILTTDGEGNVSWQTPSDSVGSCSLSIGDTYAGGIIFYLDSSGCHGLVCAPTDQAIDVPASASDFVPYSINNGIGSGFANTEYIVGILGAGNYAAKICYDLSIGGFDDWYLPSKYELDLMQLNIGGAAPSPNTNIGNFTLYDIGGGASESRIYWSSTSYYSEELDFDMFVNFLAHWRLDYGVKPVEQNVATAVRAVRVF